MATIKLSGTHKIAFLAFLLQYRYRVDGGPWQKFDRRGDEVSVAAGTHTLELANLWMLFLPTNKASAEVTLAEGETRTVHYSANWTIFQPGILSVG